ncbi:TetR/AcrR family transcriptional regulator [Leifsonia xyli]|uniref:TetR/AcrR family transcriptional regulator n=1 Tax=Leifsonia xyli TaxID=1575 RepID=UPI003D665B3E
MAKSSKTVTAQRREAIVDAATKQIKERGIDGVKIPEVMREVGMTQGGFYRHFDSKSDLTDAALRHAFDVHRGILEGISDSRRGDHSAAIEAFVELYLSWADPESLAVGCPVSALAGDVARAPMDASLRQVWVEELERIFEVVSVLGDADDVDATTQAEQRARAIAGFATLVGASMLARATAGSPLAGEIMKAVQTTFTAPVA